MPVDKKNILFDTQKQARYNVASWKSKNENIYLIAREIERKSRGNEPDFTKLILVELDRNMKLLSEEVIWQTASEHLLLEDPRAMSSKNDSVVIGLTALLRGSQGEFIPYPAVTKLNTDVWQENLPAVTIIESFGPGKNTTPVEDDIFFFRKNGKENLHDLTVFSLFNMVPKQLQMIHFPKNLPWAKLRIGTGMPPLWLEKNKALMIFHGITLKDNKYIYSLGRAVLIKEKGKFKIKIDKNPIITPDYFRDSEGNFLIEELHPHLRKVVYCCGGVLKPGTKDTLILFVNVGDMNTFLVEYPVSKLTAGLF